MNLLIYDFDGVLINSNFLKNSIIRNVCIRNFPECEDFIDSLIKSTGWTRFSLISELCSSANKGVDYEANVLLQIKNELNNALEFVEKANLPLRKPSDTHQVIVSASSHDSLVYLIDKYRWNYFFDAVYGSPRSKNEIIQNEIDLSLYDSVFVIGDSISDYALSRNINAYFIGIYGWSVDPQSLKSIDCMLFQKLDFFFASIMFQ